MTQGLYSIKETSQMIREGKILLLAGSQEALDGLPAGNWIAGSTPYFMTCKERITSIERIFVHQLPDFVTGINIKQYDETNIRNIYTDAPANGFTILIAPIPSKVLFEYALNAPNYPNFANSPVCGWVAGWSLNTSPDKHSYTMSGLNPVLCGDKAIAMHVSLPADKYAEINIFSPFKAKPDPIITFDYDGWMQEDAVINGINQNFAEYLRKNKLNTTFPLIANYAGAQICISHLKTEGDKVYSYAPVFKGIEYHLSELNPQAPTPALSGNDLIYSLSCIINFQHPEMFGSYIEHVNGPATFGEIAYQLLNQTTVYLTIGNVK